MSEVRYVTRIKYDHTLTNDQTHDNKALKTQDKNATIKMTTK